MQMESHVVACRSCRQPGRVEVLDQLGGVCLRCLVGMVLTEEERTPLPERGEEPLPLQPGETFQGFEVLELLARGGMSVVYRARQLELDRTVALKVLSPLLSSDPEFAQRFASEAKVLASLNHPHIVQVFGFGKERDLFFLSMEYIEGDSLRHILRTRRLSGSELLRVVSQVCSALEYAHGRGVVHRDIKPENLLVDRRGIVKIADFGLAKIVGDPGDGSGVTRTNVSMGTPHYMAPEQHRNLKGVDQRADLYSLGVIMYEMLTGEVPLGKFEAPSKRSAADPRLDEVILKALERLPERRYQRASELQTEIEKAASPHPASSAAIRRKRRVWVGLLGALAIFLAGLTLKTIANRRPEDLMRDMSRWTWENPAPGSGTVGRELVFVASNDKNLVEAVPTHSRLAENFSLRFQYRYEMDRPQQPWLFVIFEASPGSGHERNALLFFPEGDHSVAFASRVTGKGWGLRNHQTFVEGQYGPGKWIGCEIQWEGPTRRLRVRIDGAVTLNAQLGVMDTLHGRWNLGLGGEVKELRIRDVTVENRSK